MTVVGIIQVHNELTVDPLHLPRVFRSMRRVCEKVVAYDDGSDDGSTEWLSREADVLIVGGENDWHAEVSHKAAMLREAARFEPEWILWIDADEELSPEATRRIANGVTDDPSVTGVFLHELNLWRDRANHRIDSLFAAGWFLRLWRWSPSLAYGEEAVGLHRPQFPPDAGWCTLKFPASAPMVHYSWDSPRKIDEKLRRYCAAGDMKSLPRMVDDPTKVEREPVPDGTFWRMEDETDREGELPWLAPQLGLAHEERIKAAIRELPAGDRGVLEYGAGGSTLSWLRQMTEGDVLFVVEHRKTWADRILGEVERRGLANVPGRPNLEVLVLGRDGYATQVQLGRTPRVVIVDGKASTRVGCLRTWIRVPGVRVFVHDFENLDLSRDSMALLRAAIAKTEVRRDADPSWYARPTAELWEGCLRE